MTSDTIKLLIGLCFPLSRFSPNKQHRNPDEYNRIHQQIKDEMIQLEGMKLLASG